MKESSKRSFAKAISWRILATAVTLVIAFFFTDSIEEASAIAFLAALVLMLVYYFHERAWDRVGWGRESRVIR